MLINRAIMPYQINQNLGPLQTIHFTYEQKIVQTSVFD